MVVQHSSLEQFPVSAVARTMSALAANEYPGRLVGAGINDSGEQLHIVTATMGRRPTSRTRTYEQAGDNVFSIPFGDEVDPLTEYRTMTRINNWHIASNGDQTDTVFDALSAYEYRGVYVREQELVVARNALLTRNHEPDSSHTPRISLVAGTGSLHPLTPVLFSIIRNDPEDPENAEASQHRFYLGSLGALATRGTGQALTTYETSDDPLQAFEGGPRPIAIGDEAEETAEMIGSVLDEAGDNLVSVAAKAINIRTGRVEAVSVFNKYGPAPNYPPTANHKGIDFLA